MDSRGAAKRPLVRLEREAMVPSYVFVVQLYHDPLALDEFSWWAAAYSEWVAQDRFLMSTTSYAQPYSVWDELASGLGRWVQAPGSEQSEPY